MIVEIEAHLLTEDNITSLNRLISLCLYKRRYDLFIDIEAAKTNDFYKSLNSSDKLIIEQVYTRCVQESLRAKVVVDGEYTFDEAIRFLDQPFTIILENNNNDAPFFEKLIEEFKTKSKKIRHLDDNGWLEYGNAGGCGNIPNFINGNLKIFKGLPKKNKYEYLRCFTLVDSDKKHPNDNNNEREKLKNYLIENNIPYHILEKREMENYLPADAIPETPKNRDFLDAYKRLSPVQQDFFDIEKGFDNKNFDKLSNEVQELYKNTSQSDRNLFRKKGLEIEGNFKSEFPKYFKSEKVNRETLMNRCSDQNDKNELPHILEKISNLL